ncbi:hypothetical protein LCGC14_0815890 [marine sediment metagenome]|uniref:Big-1 domain-containing protein n=1 Tax=marine sediment metagenome TaxID=412755 RepID=A0A0F9PPY1_9ZZZZ
MVQFNLQPSTSPVRTLIVETIVVVATSLTLTLTPSSAPPGAIITYSGKLTRADGLATGVQPIKLRDDMSGAIIATTSTDASGNYSATFTAPPTDGSYYYFTQFDGAVMGTAFLAPSSSLVRETTVGIPYLQIGGPLLVGLLTVFISMRK